MDKTNLQCVNAWCHDAEELSNYASSDDLHTISIESGILSDHESLRDEVSLTRESEHGDEDDTSSDYEYKLLRQMRILEFCDYDGELSDESRENILWNQWHFGEEARRY